VGLQNALSWVSTSLPAVQVTFIGTGVVNIACSRLVFVAGGQLEQCKTELVGK
jgi:hypothetical protein